MLKTAKSDLQLNGTLSSRNVNKLNNLARQRSLPRNLFRGVKKDILQRETNLYIASMTVSYIKFAKK